MAGSAVRWATLEDVKEMERARSLFPHHAWVFERALECFDLWSSPEASANRAGRPARRPGSSRLR